jgi:hypothetical protein
MKTLVAISAVAALALVVRAAPAGPVGTTIAQAGFNTDAGYTIGQTIYLRGAGELGWGANTWMVAMNGTAGSGQAYAVVVDAFKLDGDGSLHVSRPGTSEQWWYRDLAAALSEPFWIEQYVRLPANAFFQSRPGVGGTVAAHWKVENGRFQVMDGTGGGSGTFEDTGLLFRPLEWQKVSLFIDPAAKTYEFYVDDQKYDSPDPLNFRGNPLVGGVPAVQRLDYLSQGEGWLDQVRVVAVPEPSTLALLGAAALGLFAFSRWRGRHSPV